VTFNLAGVIGGSLVPYAATWLAATRGLAWVGYYLCVAGMVSLIGALAIHRRAQAPSPMGL
jgi:hypothetical protein